MILAYKKKYQTSLEALEQLRRDQPELQDQVLSYNGILDPMAEGVLPILVGEEENKNRDRFTGSIKEYEVGVLVGVTTDSDDLLGLVNLDKSLKIEDESQRLEELVKCFLEYPREFDQTVPMHSNRKVRGKRLWWWKLQGIDIPEEERPRNKVKILEIEYLGDEHISRNDLEAEIGLMEENIGERFRKEKVVASWEHYFEISNVQQYAVVKFRLLVSSGFYVRTFVSQISQSNTIPLCVLSLKRSRILF